MNPNQGKYNDWVVVAACLGGVPMLVRVMETLAIAERYEAAQHVRDAILWIMDDVESPPSGLHEGTVAWAKWFAGKFPAVNFYPDSLPELVMWAFQEITAKHGWTSDFLPPIGYPIAPNTTNH